MKKWAIIALCLFSGYASAKDIEEVVVVGRQMKVVLVALQSNHRQNPITGNWYYVADAARISSEKPCKELQKKPKG